MVHLIMRVFSKPSITQGITTVHFWLFCQATAKIDTKLIVPYLSTRYIENNNIRILI